MAQAYATGLNRQAKHTEKPLIENCNIWEGEQCGNGKALIKWLLNVSVNQFLKDT